MNKNILYEILQDGFEAKVKEARAYEEANKGKWRVGTSGCIASAGRFVGQDPRKAVLRFLGIQTKHDFDQELMFQLGNANEDMWAELLDFTDQAYKREEAIPMTQKLGDELITGRPDFVLGTVPGCTDGKFIPSGGVELKQICSVHSAIKFSNFVDNSPKTDHVIQSATYSQYFDIPWILMYTNRVNLSVPGVYRAHRFPYDHRSLQRYKPGENVHTIKPGVSLYDLKWEEDTLLLDETPTIITKSGIIKWYEYCSKCVREKTVPMSRGGGWTVSGDSVPNSKNDNLRYDDFKGARTDTWDHWVEDCRKIADES